MKYDEFNLIEMSKRGVEFILQIPTGQISHTYINVYDMNIQVNVLQAKRFWLQAIYIYTET